MMEQNMKLSDIFNDVWALYISTEEFSGESNEKSFQDNITKAISLCETSMDVVNGLELFSNNEQIEEVATNEIRYLLLPALLGYFTSRLNTPNASDRVRKAEFCFIDFIRLCKYYGLVNCAVPEPYSASDNLPSRSQPINLDEEMRQRQKKIEAYKKHKELQHELTTLHQYVQQEHVDDEVKRKYYLKLLQKWIHEAFEALDSIQMELPILEHMKSKQSEKKETAVKQQPEKQRFAPFIITKNELQKKVIGLGYPSIPTMTVDEFYDQRVKEGVFPAQGSAPVRIEANDDEERRQAEKKQEEKEQKEEQDDAEALEQARDWDDWRDDHRRGWGNTQNKG